MNLRHLPNVPTPLPQAASRQATPALYPQNRSIRPRRIFSSRNRSGTPVREPDAPGFGSGSVGLAGEVCMGLFRGRVPEGYRPMPTCGVWRCLQPDLLALTMILD